jgi:flagellar motor switch protein FliN
MNNQPLGAVSTPAKFLMDKWAEATAGCLQSMVDARPEITWQTDDKVTLPTGSSSGDQSLYLEVSLSLLPIPSVWVFLPAATWRELGALALRAAGIDEADADELQNTCMEIMQQNCSGLSQAISARLHEPATSQLRACEAIPAGNKVFHFDIAFPETPPCTGFLYVSSQLLNRLEQKEPLEALHDHELINAGSPEGGTPNPGPTNSKTFDLLLDVSMPVSVSFGRTEMQIKDVLKLTTGSIVELNRSVTEPVDVIVNDCVVARGEVVVVEGNYGVRIHQIASRQDRLRTSGQPLASIGKPELISGLG